MSTSFFFCLHVGSGDQTWNSGSQACVMSFFYLQIHLLRPYIRCNLFSVYVTYFQFLCWNDSCSWARVTYSYPLPVYSLGVLVLIHVSVHFHRLGEENSTSDLCFVSAVSLFYCFDGKNVCNIFDHFTSL